MSRDSGGMILSRTVKYSENNLTHSTTNPTWTGLTLAMGLWSDRPWLPSWAMALPVKMLITIWVCSVNIICDLTHSQVCSCVWLYHRADILHAWTESILTPYSIICVICPAAVTYDRWLAFTNSCTDNGTNMKALLLLQNLKTESTITNSQHQ
jgi:hypothetical protein